MSWIYRSLLRPSLFERDSEGIHDWTLRFLGAVGRREWCCEAMTSFCGASPLPTRAFGLAFRNPIGLAAGMDKAASAVPVWEAMGFGFCELGGVTLHPQPGNPRPRIFRAIADEALVNSMGFNNPGAEAVAEALSFWRANGRWPQHPVGINLGKSRVTPIESAADDYLTSFQLLRPHADFFVVNVSSPNTPNLRSLQDKTALDEILSALQHANGVEGGPSHDPSPGAGSPPPSVQPKPLLIKVAPDLDADALDEILDLCEQRNISGIIATNTTIARPETSNPRLARVYAEPGGLSGRPLRRRSTEVVRHLYRRSRGRIPIIGVGGILTPDDAWEKITAGAALIQIYTGLVYQGPQVVRELVEGLIERLEIEGLADISDAVGIYSEQDHSIL